LFHSIETIISNFLVNLLIVTERNGYGKRAHMNFVMVENKLKFEVNLKAINKVGIGISSFYYNTQLLSNKKYKKTKHT
jgi:hypothetical protein